MLKIVRLKAIYYGNRHKYLQLIEAISNFRHPHPSPWLGKETSLFQVMLPALLREKIHQAPSVVTSHYFCCLCFISCLTAHSRNTFKRVAHIGNLKFSGPQTPQMNFLRSDVIHAYDRILSPPWRSSWEGLTVLAPGWWGESLLSNSSALNCQHDRQQKCRYMGGILEVTWQKWGYRLNFSWTDCTEPSSPNYNGVLPKWMQNELSVRSFIFPP